MNTLEAIKSRRSIKQFDPNFQMTSFEKEQLISLAMLSPTAFNVQNWRFVIVSDTNLRNKISKAAYGQPQVTDSSLLIILCADLEAWNKAPNRYWKNAPKEAQDYVLPVMEGYYKNNPQVQRDEAMRSCGIAAQTLMLAAKSMGYDSCPMIGFDFNEVAKLIKLPEDHVISMFVTIGKAMKEAWNRPGQLDLNDIMVSDMFNHQDALEQCPEC
ncbi:nitroreductase family protein [Pararhizobium sp.]|uniref:nitroreductase family protein n=1 Tax=Pararhizobium sp. TaxID=1977563 RepID=UPI002718829A|nr:nitroreductase family protein [Pararhizobium sp.]MDO9417349.1 nitroreductase family protein [Pararhizobium sp.]